MGKVIEKKNRKKLRIFNKTGWGIWMHTIIKNIHEKKEKHSVWLEGRFHVTLKWGRVYCFSKDKQVTKVSLQRPDSRKSRKAIHKTPSRLFCAAGLFICCKGHTNLNDCKVSFLETPLFWRYKENYVTRKASEEKLRDFRETGSRSQLFKGWIPASIG